MKNGLSRRTFLKVLGLAVAGVGATGSLENMAIGEEKKYSDFKFQEELPLILYTAKRVGVEPELMLAIRMAEQGREGLEFGIIPTPLYERDKGIIENGKFREYNSKLEKQISWCAWTIKKNKKRWGESGKKGDFINFLGNRYCPVGAENDPDGLNKNWIKNVKFYYERFKN